MTDRETEVEKQTKTKQEMKSNKAQNKSSWQKQNRKQPKCEQIQHSLSQEGKSHIGHNISVCLAYLPLLHTFKLFSKSPPPELLLYKRFLAEPALPLLFYSNFLMLIS